MSCAPIKRFFTGDSLGTVCVGIFKGSKKLGGGIYLVGFPDRARNFEILIDKNQKFSIVADTNKLQSIIFVNSPENISFKDYQKHMSTNGRSMDSLLQLRSSSNEKDSIKITAQIEALNNKIRTYRNDIITKSPTSLMAALMQAMKEPEVPYNAPEAKTDSLLKSHLSIGKMSLKLIYTKIIDLKIDKTHFLL